MTRKARWWLIAVSIMAVPVTNLLLFAFLHATSVQLSPEAALQKFYVYGDDPHEVAAEDMLMDPLILAGEEVVPLVIEAVKDKNMPRRAYAIGFLGNGSYTQAIPVLQNILQDVSEPGYFRGDVLRAIYQIDASLGWRLAKEYETQPGHLGQIARMILTGDSDLRWQRSYFDALVGRHD